jgi:hypothetical protein
MGQRAEVVMRYMADRRTRLSAAKLLNQLQRVARIGEYSRAESAARWSVARCAASGFVAPDAGSGLTVGMVAGRHSVAYQPTKSLNLSARGGSCAHFDRMVM